MAISALVISLRLRLRLYRLAYWVSELSCTADCDRTL